MKHPPYHLRVNKAIDRFLLVEILDILKRHCDISDYTYYGFGGPFLEDCRLIHDRYPEINIVSVERDEETYKRQKFHSFSKKLDLIYGDFDGFIADFSCGGGEIFWLDYTNLVVCQPSVEGYSLLSLMRASSVVNRHLTVARC